MCSSPEDHRPTLEELRGRRARGTPCLRLALAILDDALEILLAGREHKPQRWLETVEWVLNDDRTWLFSFRTLCDLLDVDAVTLRSVLRPWLQVRPVTRLRLIVPAAASRAAEHAGTSRIPGVFG
jgi:hypothetical protein